MVQYICTNCTRPTSSLYKVYSTPGSIKLTTCQRCHHDVDPYIEREWLLVIIDCILHRPEAFRHVLYNREPFCNLASNEMTPSCREFVQYSVATYLIRICLWYVTSLGEEKGKPLYHGADEQDVFTILMQLLIGDFVMITSIILTGTIMLRDNTMIQKESNKPNASEGIDVFIFSRIYLALTIPIFFHTITLVVSIWENCSTIYLLGSLFVLSLQRMGVATVMEERYCDRESRKNQTAKLGCNQNLSLLLSYLLNSFPFIIGSLTYILVQTVAFGQISQVGIGISESTVDRLPWSFFYTF